MRNGTRTDESVRGTGPTAARSARKARVSKVVRAEEIICGMSTFLHPRLGLICIPQTEKAVMRNPSRNSKVFVSLHGGTLALYDSHMIELRERAQAGRDPMKRSYPEFLRIDVDQCDGAPHSAR